MTSILCGVFFVSGASALIFENLWFHQAGLALGNSVWASSLVLTAFMAGLALGNLVAAKVGDRFTFPLRLYAGIEALIGFIGFALVYVLPKLGALLAPHLAPWVDRAWVINPIRFLLGFVLLLFPATAMGMTLPLLTKAVVALDHPFGSGLGKLYGWNTFGAVTGVVFAELLFVERLGIHGTALVATGLSLLAAVVAFELGGLHFAGRSAKAVSHSLNSSWRNRWVIAVFFSGFCLLSLEVIWFRFLSLYIMTTTVAFALMLAIVLAGIAVGGLAGSVWLARNRKADLHSASLAFLAGVLCTLCYKGFTWVIHAYGSVLSLPRLIKPQDIVHIGFPLMFPVSFVSGMFFVLAGSALRSEMNSEMETAGALSVANTLGAALGAFLAGFWLLPTFGIERSFFVIAILYGGVGVLLMHKRSRWSSSSAVLFVLISLLFPFGTMQREHLKIPENLKRMNVVPAIEAVREGLQETIIYLRMEWAGKTISHKMITNSFSMSGTSFEARRYMKLYVWWPVAVHPQLKSALLISYGVGNTAKALTDTQGIETIDVVDTSGDILEMSSIPYSEPDQVPLRDPRVRVHVEDGRYFLQATDRRFHLITGEPPPPAAAGVVNLYTREYFELLYQRLAEGGIVTYWLPMHDVSDESAKAILKSFCLVFEDCSLWTGSGPELMMVGTRHAQGPVSLEYFLQQWKDPVVSPELKKVGIEKPEQLGALFIADADDLRAYLKETPPLVDDYPKRIVAKGSEEGFRELSRAWTNVTEAQERFRRSSLIRRLWPEPMRTGSLPYFEIQESLNLYLNNPWSTLDLYIPHLHRLLTQTSLRTAPFWFLGTNADQQKLLDDVSPEEMTSAPMQYLYAARALSMRRYADAIKPLAAAEALPGRGPEMFRYRIYALCMSGQVRLAQRLARERLPRAIKESGAQLSPYWEWLKRTFGIDPLNNRLVGRRESKFR